MKKFLLFSTAIACSLLSFAQSTSFDDGNMPPDWFAGQGMKVAGYNNPINDCADDFGLQTPGVGGNNPAFVIAPPSQYSSLLPIVQVSFAIYVLNANLDCKTAKPFPCPTKVKAYIVPESYTSNQPPAEADTYGYSEPVLVNANAINTISVRATKALSPDTKYRIYIDFSVDGNCNQGNTKYVIDNIRILETEQIPLPVSFKSFTASRSKNNVTLKWETAGEQNNRGFNVQRHSGTEWKNIAFVFSQAEGGNSSSVLQYYFNDANPVTGNAQYRIQQVDINGYAKYSDIRSVQADPQGSRVQVFPNPSHTGIVNLLFEDGNNPRNVIVSDMTGRIIKHYRSVSGNSLTIENLSDGYYSIQVVNVTTAATTVEKVILKKR